jgi:DNA-directed RNA polymerase subunit omega
MLYPSIDKLMAKTDSKYSLVVLAAKRARQLLEGSRSKIKIRSKKFVGIALEEMVNDTLKLPSPDREIH